MKNLILSSFLILIFSCSTSYLNNFTEIDVRTLNDFEVRAISLNKYDDIKFITDVDAYGYSISGILIVKKFSDGFYKVGFLDQIGIVLFSFEISRDEFNLIYCIEQLNNKNMIKVLETDLRIILFPSIPIDEVKVFSSIDSGEKAINLINGNNDLYYFIDDSQIKLRQIDYTQDDRLILSIQFHDTRTSNLKNIYIKHYDYPLEIKLEEFVDE